MVRTAFFSALLIGSLAAAQTQGKSAAGQAAAPKPQAAAQAQSSGQLPQGIHREGTDNVLVDQYGIPLDDQSGKSIPQQAAATDNVPTGGVDTSGVPTTNAPNQPGDTVNVPQNGQPITDKNGNYIFKAQAQLVQLHATVVDQKQRLVTGLNKSNFTVFEDGQPQPIVQFSQEDIPVSIGILIDNSGSMRMKRQAVNTAAINLVKASNPKDEVFIVNFADEPFLDQDFTASIPKMREALDQVDSRGGTAMYDAVVAASDHLAKGARREKKALLVVTDGEDNESTKTLEDAIRSVQDDNGPTIYTIGILDDDDPHKKRARRALEALALQTGGVAYFPKDLGEVDSITQDIARDIRQQYYIQYRPTRPQDQGGYRTVKVEARLGRDKLQVRTRTGYFANASQAQGQPNQAPANGPKGQQPAQKAQNAAPKNK